MGRLRPQRVLSLSLTMPVSGSEMASPRAEIIMINPANEGLIPTTSVAKNMKKT
jgi:hypothetical protein